MTASPRSDRILASKQFRNGKFHNTSGIAAAMSGSALALMGDLLFGGRKRVPKSPLPLENPIATWATPPSSGLRITWLGHSTLVIESDGARILTDPVFGNYASPGWFAGRKRFHPVPVKLSELPPLDAVLLSHDHYDHLCTSTMREIARMRLPIVTSLAVGARLEKLGVAPELITELDWWEEYSTPDGKISFTATPAQHFSGRGISDRNDTLWSSWVLKTESKSIFFSGDTGLNDDLQDIAKRFGPFDVTLLEIGASNPAWEGIHLGPANALRAFEKLGGGTFIPIHWGTFDLALHVWNEPAETLVELAEKAGVRVLTPRLGQPIEPEYVEGPTPWWRPGQEGSSAGMRRARETALR